MVDMLTMPKALGLVGLNHREERERMVDGLGGTWSPLGSLTGVVALEIQHAEASGC